MFSSAAPIVSTAPLFSNFQPVISNFQPVIGVVTEPTSTHGNSTSYIAASYVKWIESAGGRVVPLRYDAPVEETEALMKGLNGLLYPGGGASLDEGSAFYQGARSMWEFALKSNEAGEHYPVWGTWYYN